MLYVNPLDARMAKSLGEVYADIGKAREKAALQELEHLFLYTLLREMHKTVDISGRSSTSREKDLYEEMFDDAVSGEMARSGQLGIARQIEQQLKAAADSAKTAADTTLKQIKEVADNK